MAQIKNITTIQLVYYWIASLAMLILMMIYGQFVIVPILFSIVLAVLIDPFVQLLKRICRSHLLSYLLVILSVLGSIGTIGAAIYWQLKSVFGTLDIEDVNIEKVKDEIVTMMPEGPGWHLKITDLVENAAQDILSITSDILKMLIGSGGNIIYILGLSIIFAYFLSTNYEMLKTTIFNHISQKHKNHLESILFKVPSITRSYMRGMVIVMLLLAVINSVAFWLIGLDYAILWGGLIGLLAIIPYVGSMIGLILPLSYSLIQSDSLTQPVLIVAAFAIVQQIEGNILTPKIVGDRVNVDPLLVIIFMLIFGKIWGIMGVVLSLPLAGCIRVVMHEYNDTKLIARLMANHIDPSEEQ